MLELVATMALGLSSLSLPYDVEEGRESYLELNDRTFSVQNVNSGMCLDREGASREEGANVQQYPCKGSSNQIFRIRITIFDNSPYVSLENVKSGHSLTIDEGSLDERAENIIQKKHTIYTNEEVVLWSLYPTDQENIIQVGGNDMNKTTELILNETRAIDAIAAIIRANQIGQKHNTLSWLSKKLVSNRDPIYRKL